MICSLRFKEDLLNLKMLLCFKCCAFGFEAIPHRSCYLTSIVDEIQPGSVIPSLSMQRLQLFWLRSWRPSKKVNNLF